MFVKKMSEQTSPKLIVKRKEHLGLKIVIHSFDGNSENSKEGSARIGLQSEEECLSLMEEAKEIENREKNIILTNPDFIQQTKRTVSARSLDGTPLTGRDEEWNGLEISGKNNLSGRSKSKMLRHCNSLEQSSAGGVFT